MKYSKVTLKVPGYKDKTIKYDFEPKCETDLLKNSEYIKYFYSVGLGAPVTAIVAVYDGLLKKETYSFSYKIRGNEMDHETFLNTLMGYKAYYVCEDLHAEPGVQKMIFSFESNKKAYELYQKLEGIANIGVYHGMTQTGKPAVQIEYHHIQD